MFVKRTRIIQLEDTGQQFISVPVLIHVCINGIIAGEIGSIGIVVYIFLIVIELPVGIVGGGEVHAS